MTMMPQQAGSKIKIRSKMGLRHRRDFYRADFQFGGLGHGVVAGAGQDIDGDVGEGEGGEDGAFGGLVSHLDLDLDFAAGAGHLGHASVDEAEGVGVVGVDLEGFVRKEVFDAGTAPGLGAGVIGLESTAGGEPEREVIADDFSRVTVADDFEEAFHAVLEFSLVKARGAGVFLVGNGPVILAFVDAVPVETGVDGAELAELVEDVFGGLVFEAGRTHTLGNFADDPPVGFGFAPGLDGFAESLDTALGVGLDTIGFAPRGGGQDDVGKLAGLGQEDVDDNEVI